MYIFQVTHQKQNKQKKKVHIHYKTEWHSIAIIITVL